MNEGKWYTASGNEVDDPLEQLKRCESQLRRLLHDLGCSLPIESRLVFVNPIFYLFQAPMNLPIIVPAHLNRYMNQLKKKSGKLDDRHLSLAQKLASLHKKKSPFTRVPPYSYEQLKKGNICRYWCGFMDVFNKETLICRECGQKETVESAVLRNVAELKMMFRNLKITTFIVYEWCGSLLPIKTIRRILMRNFEYRGYGKSSHFVNR
jgi:predicted nucleic acid-binding Zn ribbon protein